MTNQQPSPVKLNVDTVVSVIRALHNDTTLFLGDDDTVVLSGIVNVFNASQTPIMHTNAWVYNNNGESFVSWLLNRYATAIADALAEVNESRDALESALSNLGIDDINADDVDVDRIGELFTDEYTPDNIAYLAGNIMGVSDHDVVDGDDFTVDMSEVERCQSALDDAISAHASAIRIYRRMVNAVSDMVRVYNQLCESHRIESAHHIGEVIATGKYTDGVTSYHNEAYWYNLALFEFDTVQTPDGLYTSRCVGFNTVQMLQIQFGRSISDSTICDLYTIWMNNQ